MSSIFNQLTQSTSAHTKTNPIEIFSVLPNKKQSHNYLRSTQAEILIHWNARRSSTNNIIKMNTGSGKSLVGLLILKSLLNEKKGPAVYVVPNNYLVKQIQNEAQNLGIDTTTSHQDTGFITQNKILITTINKLVNGRSIFGTGGDQKIPIKSIIIDDAHTCLETVRSQFSLEIKQSHALYNEILKTLESYFMSYCSSKFENIKNGNSDTLRIPFWIWAEVCEEINRTISLYYSKNEKIDDIFNYPIISNYMHISECTINHQKIEITPICPPIQEIPSFYNATHRIFMSATYGDDSTLNLTFQVPKSDIENAIRPQSYDDIGDRIILTPQITDTNISDQEIRIFVKEMSNSHNIVVLCPSHQRAKLWESYSSKTYTADNIEQGIQSLKSQTHGLTILINKYDGVDLPDNMCRILVIDDIPDTRSLTEKTDESMLKTSKYIAQKRLQKIEQGMGRGIRSIDDYCAVILMGFNLINNIYNYEGSPFTPSTQIQYNLSNEVMKLLSQNIATSSNPIKILEHIYQTTLLPFLNRDQSWVQASRAAVTTASNPENHPKNQTNYELRAAFDKATINKYEEAVSIIQTHINTSTQNDPSKKSWLLYLAASYSYKFDKIQGHRMVASAAELNHQIPTPKDINLPKNIAQPIYDQATNSLNYIQNKFSGEMDLMQHINFVLSNLEFVTVQHQNFESAMEDLGFLLGFTSQQPEKIYSQGPDVLWHFNNGTVLVIECKNEATTDVVKKDYCNQLNGSYLWYTNKYGIGKNVIPVMVHPSNIISFEASLQPQAKIINKASLNKLKIRISDHFKYISKLPKFGTQTNMLQSLRENKIDIEHLLQENSKDYTKETP